MKKFCFLILAFLCMFTAVAYADIPSPLEMEQRRAERQAVLLEKDGLKINDIAVVRQQDGDDSAVFKLFVSCPKGGTFVCSILDRNSGESIAQDMRGVMLAGRTAQDNVIVLPSVKGFSKGKYDLRFRCTYTIEYITSQRLGGGYEWFRKGRPTRREEHKVEKEYIKDIVLLITENKYFIY